MIYQHTQPIQTFRARFAQMTTVDDASETMHYSRNLSNYDNHTLPSAFMDMGSPANDEHNNMSNYEQYGMGSTLHNQWLTQPYGLPYFPSIEDNDQSWPEPPRTSISAHEPTTTPSPTEPLPASQSPVAQDGQQEDPFRLTPVHYTYAKTPRHTIPLESGDLRE